VKAAPGGSPGAGATSVCFRLYVAASSPNTRRAIDNLHALCSAAGHPRYDLKIIDVLRDPRRAVTDGILVAPTLVKVAPAPVRTIVGDLSDRDAVLATLELPGSGTGNGAGARAGVGE